MQKTFVEHTPARDPAAGRMREHLGPFLARLTLS